jgi:hypothetical protein
MVLLDTKLKVIPFFVARAVVCILRIEARKQLRFDGVVCELCDCFLESVTLTRTRSEVGHFDRCQWYHRLREPRTLRVMLLGRRFANRAWFSEAIETLMTHARTLLRCNSGIRVRDYRGKRY